ncbi:MAG: YlmC/YmxH family sporulation protein [Clostridia bacterium]|nr:YlmC/YmxH family sporulation protein [Clostridia bacterium]
MENSFSELRSKLVINLSDGKKLGHIIDLIFEQNTAKILGVIVPGNRGFFSIFKAKEDIFIPYHSICKIGEDTVLVQLTPTGILNHKDINNQPQYSYLPNTQNKNS